jgi:protein-disulfide isomerase
MIPDRALQPKVLAMSAFFRCLAVTVLLAGSLAAPTRAAEPLTPEQKQAVEGIVHDYLLTHPEFLIEVAHAAQQKIKQDKADDARQAIATYRKQLFADATSPVGGNPDGDVTIVEFFDYRCPYCKQVEPALEALLKEDAKIRIIYKEFPVLGAESVYASRMALAAAKQDKYLAFHKAMMATKGQITDKVILQVAATAGVDIGKAKADMIGSAIKDVIQRNYSLAEALDINGTPAFIVGDVLVPGATDMDGLRKLVADARKPG